MAAFQIETNMVVIYTAPVGGIWLAGRKYNAGHFIPQDVVRKIRDDERKKLVPHKVR